jgi:UDP-2,3-diacylglucosamine hydrolase
MKAYSSLPPITLGANKKIYFASDFHLGMPDAKTSLIREKKICEWLLSIAPTAEHIFLLGDIFDAWIEYKRAVPKGFTRLLGTLANIADSGVKITIFTGNHDLWCYGYFEEELGIPVLHHPVTININDKKFFLGHGDGLGPGDRKYKFLKKFLNHPVCQWLYARIHPNTGIWLAEYFSGRGADKKDDDNTFLGEDKEYLILFCKEYLQHQHADYFLFGHRHYKLDLALSDTSRYLNLGDWLQYDSYAVFDGVDCKLEVYKAKH